MTTELTKAAQQDITERLRKDKWHITGVDAEEAAQLIEELREQLAKAKADERHIYEAYSRCADERSALTQRPAAQEVARFEAGCNVLEYLKQEGAPYRITSQMLIALHGDPEGRPAPQQATPASAPQSLLMRLAGIAAECSDPDTTDALDALIATTQQATPTRATREAEQRARMQARLATRHEGKATADFDLPPPNDAIQQATPEPVLMAPSAERGGDVGVFREYFDAHRALLAATQEHEDKSRTKVQGHRTPSQATSTFEPIEKTVRRNKILERRATKAYETYKSAQERFNNAARAALATQPAAQATPEPVGEPVARIDGPVRPAEGLLWRAEITLIENLPQYTDLYTRPAPAAQAVPMTREQRNAVFEAAEVLMKADINLPWRDALITATEAHHGITAQGAQGGKVNRG